MFEVSRKRSHGELMFEQARYDSEGNGEYDTEDEAEEEATFIAKAEECISGNQLVLVMRRALSMKIKEGERAQRENLFYARCQIKDKVWSPREKNMR